MDGAATARDTPGAAPPSARPAAAAPAPAGAPAGPAVYPEARAAHAAVLADRALFLKLLADLHEQLAGVPQPAKTKAPARFKAPVVCGKEVDLHALYSRVTAQGGLEAVIANRGWTDVCEPLNFPPSFTSKSFTARKIYCQHLHHFEQVYYHRRAGQPIADAPATAPPQAAGAKPAVAAAAPAGEQQQQQEEEGEEQLLSPHAQRHPQCQHGGDEDGSPAADDGAGQPAPAYDAAALHGGDQLRAAPPPPKRARRETPAPQAGSQSPEGSAAATPLAAAGAAAAFAGSDTGGDGDGDGEAETGPAGAGTAVVGASLRSLGGVDAGGVAACGPGPLPLLPGLGPAAAGAVAGCGLATDGSDVLGSTPLLRPIAVPGMQQPPAPAAGAPPPDNGAPGGPRALPEPAPPQGGGGGGFRPPCGAPEFSGFAAEPMAAHGRDLTGLAVEGTVDARFDCGYFVSLCVGGAHFRGILYCPMPGGLGAAAGPHPLPSAADAPPAGPGAAGGPAPARGGGAAGGGASGAAGGVSGVSGLRPRGEPFAHLYQRQRPLAAAGRQGSLGGGALGKRARAQLHEKPKASKTAFNFFAAAHWQQAKSQVGPGASSQDVSRLVGEWWARTPAAAREPFVLQAAADKRRYLQERRRYERRLAGGGSSSEGEDEEGDEEEAAPAPRGVAAAGAASRGRLSASGSGEAAEDEEEADGGAPDASAAEASEGGAPPADDAAAGRRRRAQPPPAPLQLLQQVQQQGLQAVPPGALPLLHPSVFAVAGGGAHGLGGAVPIDPQMLEAMMAMGLPAGFPPDLHIGGGGAGGGGGDALRQQHPAQGPGRGA